ALWSRRKLVRRITPGSCAVKLSCLCCRAHREVTRRGDALLSALDRPDSFRARSGNRRCDRTAVSSAPPFRAHADGWRDRSSEAGCDLLRLRLSDEAESPDVTGDEEHPPLRADSDADCAALGAARRLGIPLESVGLPRQTAVEGRDRALPDLLRRDDELSRL